MTRTHKYLIAIVLLGLLLGTAQAEPLRVTVLLAEEGVAYREFALSFAVEAERKNLPLSISQTDTLPPDTGLIVAVGIRSATMALNSHAPVLNVLVSKVGFGKLLHDLPVHREKNTFSAIYLDQPSRRQIDLITSALPEAKNIGLLFSAQLPEIASLRKAVAENRLVLHEQKIGSADSLHRDLLALLQISDVLLAVPDAQIYNSSTMRNILLSTYRNEVPVVGLSVPYVRAGALCAVFSTPDQIAAQAADVAGQFLATGRLPPAQYPIEFDVMVNRQVARSLGIQIKEPAALIRQIKAASAGGAG